MPFRRDPETILNALQRGGDVTAADLRRRTPAPPPSPEASLNNLAVEIPLASLDPDPEQPRRLFDRRALDELKNSIDQHGLLQPLVVRPRQGPGSRGRYWIVAGERRFRAATELGYEAVPCVIRSYTNMQALVVSLAENLHREDLDAIEKSEALHRLRTITEKSWEEIADLVKLSESHVKTLARFKNLDDEVKQLVRDRKLSDRKAIALLPLSGRQQREMAQEAVAQDLPAETIREKVQQALPRLTRNTVPTPPLPETEIPEAGLVGSKGGITVAREPYAGPIVQIVKGFTAALQRVDHWLESRNWAPSQISTAQRAAIDELYHVASSLQQRLILIRNGWRFGEGEQQTPETDGAERLRRALTAF